MHFVNETLTIVLRLKVGNNKYKVNTIMNIKLTLQIGDSEVYRNYEAESIEDIDWQKAVESMADSMTEENAVNNLVEGNGLNEKEKMALGY